MTSTSKPIKCIQCGRIKAVRKLADGTCWCDHCNIRFDPVDDGTTGYGRPDNNAARNEEYIMRKQGRLKRK